MHNHIYVRTASSLFTGHLCPQVAPVGLLQLCVVNTWLIFPHSRCFVLINTQHARILDLSYNYIKIFLTVIGQIFVRSFKTKTECRCKPPTLMSCFLPFFVHNRNPVCSLDYSVVFIFVLISTIHNYNLTRIFRKSLTFPRPTNMHVNSILTQETVHKPFQISGGTDENVV